jgi:hypothetical protein
MEWKHGHPQQTCEKQLNAFWPLRKRLDVVPSEAESSLLGAFLCKMEKPPTTAAGNTRDFVRPSSPGSHSHIVIVSADARDGPGIHGLLLGVGDCACKETGTLMEGPSVKAPTRPDQTRQGHSPIDDITDTTTATALSTTSTTTTTAMAAKSYKEEKEAWVSGHMGGSVADVNSVSFAMPVPYTWRHARADVLLTTTSS